MIILESLKSGKWTEGIEIPTDIFARMDMFLIFRSEIIGRKFIREGGKKSKWVTLTVIEDQVAALGAKQP